MYPYCSGNMKIDHFRPDGNKIRECWPTLALHVTTFVVVCPFPPFLSQTITRLSHFAFQRSETHRRDATYSLFVTKNLVVGPL